MFDANGKLFSFRPQVHKIAFGKKRHSLKIVIRGIGFGRNGPVFWAIAWIIQNAKSIIIDKISIFTLCY